MGRAQASRSASTNRGGASKLRLSDALAGYEAWLLEQPLAARTRQTYRQQVTGYVAWLLEGGVEASTALGEGPARDHAVRDYKAHLKAVRGARPSSVNLALAAIDHFYRCLGAGKPSVRREELAQAAPRALSLDEQRALLRAGEQASARDRAIVTVLIFTALRLSELAALDIGDVPVSARKGLVVVRSGKGDAFREVPLNAEARGALERWLAERERAAADDELGLFVGRAGRRLSSRSIDTAVRNVGKQAGIGLSAHVLRHTCVTNLVRQGHDLVLVAELAGHRRLETTRRYSLPSDADRQAAMEGIRIDY